MVLEPLGVHVERGTDVEYVSVLSYLQVRQCGLGTEIDNKYGCVEQVVR